MCYKNLNYLKLSGQRRRNAFLQTIPTCNKKLNNLNNFRKEKNTSSGLHYETVSNKYKTNLLLFNTRFEIQPYLHNS